VGIENLLGINTEHVAPILSATYVETRRHVPAGVGRCFLQRCKKGSLEVVVFSLICLCVLLLSESLGNNDCVLQSTKRPEVVSSYVTGHVLVIAGRSGRHQVQWIIAPRLLQPSDCLLY